MRINEEVSQAQHVAGIISGTAKTSSTASVKSVAYRAPVHLLAAVDAMAVHAKKSRNAMINLLLQVGIDEVRENLDQQDVIEKLSALEFEALQGYDLQSSETITE